MKKEDIKELEPVDAEFEDEDEMETELEDPKKAKKLKKAKKRGKFREKIANGWHAVKESPAATIIGAVFGGIAVGAAWVGTAILGSRDKTEEEVGEEIEAAFLEDEEPEMDEEPEDIE